MSNELREAEIDDAREMFEESCRDIVASLTGWDSIMDGTWKKFDYDEVTYTNHWVDVCWQSYIKGRRQSSTPLTKR